MRPSMAAISSAGYCGKLWLLTALALVGVCGYGLWLYFLAAANSVSPADYAIMAQELVEQNRLYR